MCFSSCLAFLISLIIFLADYKTKLQSASDELLGSKRQVIRLEGELNEQKGLASTAEVRLKAAEKDIGELQCSLQLKSASHRVQLAEVEYKAQCKAATEINNALNVLDKEKKFRRIGMPPRPSQ